MSNIEIYALLIILGVALAFMFFMALKHLIEKIL